MNVPQRIPSLGDNGLILWDSHVINTYLVNKYVKYQPLYPEDLIN